MKTMAADSNNDERVLPDLIAVTAEAVGQAEDFLAHAVRSVRAQVSSGGKVSPEILEQNQFAAHGIAWLATYVETLRQLQGYAARLDAEGRLGELEALLVQAAFGEFLAQLLGGVPMSQGEAVRPADFGLDDDVIVALDRGAARQLMRAGANAAVRGRIAALITEQMGVATFGDAGLDETLNLVRVQFRRFADEKVLPFAHQWHLNDEYIPLEVVGEMGKLGVFGLTIPEVFGGHGMGKEAMCVVSEELSRGYIGVGSLGTRSEIAAELILGGGTEAQKNEWLPRLASGEILPTAVFTEPNVGSDLASLRTRAAREGDVYRVRGNKTWITHAARADLMTLLVRTNPDVAGYKGLSMFLAPKPRGTDSDPFPALGMTGGEIGVLGYRGMKEFEIAFDGFEVPAEGLLGDVEGEGFKQLMQTFESARVQTAARAIGVAQSAMELALQYASERAQFGKEIMAFPRISGKIAMMAIEILAARQLTYFAARQKDQGRRCDLEAGMAKLLAARVAWSAADNAVQVHGGNGFALEYPVSRVLCDARILNIFEGAAEIQAQVIARRLLDGVN